MRHVAVVVLALGAMGCGAAPAAPPAPPATPFVDARSAPAPSPAESPREPLSLDRWSPLVATTLVAVGRVRGLAPRHAVPCAVVGRGDLLARVKDHVTREVPPAAIRAEGIAQKLLGFVPTSMDYEAAEYELLGGQIAGYYEPANGTMYLASDQDDENAAATLSHELVHALQDQYWDLRARSGYVAGQDDRDGATSALAEGDATSAMEDMTETRAATGKTALDTPDDVFVEQWRESLETSFPRATPHALKTALVASYVDGTLFVNALRRRGGWALVDEAWERPPTTTEQILHPDKWRAHEPPLDVALPPPPPSSTRLPLVEANTYGEQGLRLAFLEWMSASSASLAASGWGGDRVGIYGDDDRGYAMLWHVRFDDASPAPPGTFAARAFDALATALPARGRLALRDAETLCVERAGNGVLAARRDGRDLLLAFGTVVPAVGSEPWHPRMTCEQAIAWDAAAMRPPHAS